MTMAASIINEKASAVAIARRAANIRASTALVRRVVVSRKVGSGIHKLLAEVHNGLARSTHLPLSDRVVAEHLPKEYDRVKSLSFIQREGYFLSTSLVGTIVHVHDNGRAFEVEFAFPIEDVITLYRDELELYSDEA